MSQPNLPRPSGRNQSDDPEESTYDPAITHGTVGSWSYIVFHDDEQPMKAKQALGFHTLKGKKR